MIDFEWEWRGRAKTIAAADLALSALSFIITLVIWEDWLLNNKNLITLFILPHVYDGYHKAFVWLILVLSFLMRVVQLWAACLLCMGTQLDIGLELSLRHCRIWQLVTFSLVALDLFLVILFYTSVLPVGLLGLPIWEGIVLGMIEFLGINTRYFVHITPSIILVNSVALSGNFLYSIQKFVKELEDAVKCH